MRPLTLKEIVLNTVTERLSNKISSDQLERKLHKLKRDYGVMEVLRTFSEVISENFRGITLGKLMGL